MADTATRLAAVSAELASILKDAGAGLSGVNARAIRLMIVSADSIAANIRAGGMGKPIKGRGPGGPAF